jgi:transcriptional regulator with XRE-family HTH domain
LRAGLRQVDVARRAGVSQSLVSAIEGGRCATVTMDALRRVFAAVGAGFEGQVLWRGPALERLLDARHAALVDASAIRLRRWGWDVTPEVTYSSYGERGSIDLLGARADRRAVVVEEVKSELARIEETLRKLDEKARLIGGAVGRERLGWAPRVVGRVLILPDTDRARRQVAAHAPVFDVALPARGSVLRAWLRDPVESIAGILFVADIDPGRHNAVRTGTQRVRVGAGGRNGRERRPG